MDVRILLENTLMKITEFYSEKSETGLQFHRKQQGSPHGAERKSGFDPGPDADHAAVGS